MRDGQRRVVARDDLQLRLDRALGARVERGRRLVEYQYRGALEDRARDCDALLFAARQLEAALADRRRVAFRQPRGEIVDLRKLRRRDDLVVRRTRAAKRCCIRSMVEQHRVLRHDADRRGKSWRTARMSGRRSTVRRTS
jgi:hypothetical protein